MKYRTTAKEIRNYGGKVVSAGYCDLQTLLSNREPNAYTCGVYGWNFDVYNVNGITICTGYRGMVGRRANNIDKYEKKAQDIRKKHYSFGCTGQRWSYERYQKALDKLLAEFCEQA